MTDELLDQKPVFEVEGVEPVCSHNPFRGVPLREYSWNDIARLENVESVLFTRIFLQTPYVGTKNNDARTLSSFLLVLNLVCQAWAWIREINDDLDCEPGRGSLFEAWGLDENPALDSLFEDLAIDPLSSETRPTLFNKSGLMYFHEP